MCNLFPRKYICVIFLHDVAAVDGDVTPVMVSEDFSDMLNARPGAFMFIGNGNSALLHHPEYEFNDAAIPYGAAWLAGMVVARG